MYAIELVSLRTHIPIIEGMLIKGCCCGWSLESCSGGWSAFVTHLPVVTDQTRPRVWTEFDKDFMKRARIAE